MTSLRPSGSDLLLAVGMLSIRHLIHGTARDKLGPVVV
jgi:hypothetical protein